MIPVPCFTANATKSAVAWTLVLNSGTQRQILAAFEGMDVLHYAILPANLILPVAPSEELSPTANKKEHCVEGDACSEGRPSSKTCRRFRRRGFCKYGAQCYFIHKSTDGSPEGSCSDPAGEQSGVRTRIPSSGEESCELR